MPVPGQIPPQIPPQQVPRELALAASVPVRVSDADIDGLVLTLAAGSTVTGKLIVEGQPISSIPNLSSLRLNLQMKLNGLGLPRASEIAADGSFQISGLRDGEYRPAMNLNSPGIYIQSIKYDGKEIQGTTFQFISARPGTFEVVLKSSGPIVSGKVSDAQAHPASGVAVAIVPADRERLDLYRRTDADQDGNFMFNINLPPGKYKVFSWEDVDSNAVRDADFLKQYEQFGKEILAREGSNPSIDVIVIPAQ